MPCRLQDDRPPAKSIEEMAARYLAEVRRVQPQGPYRLGGWSMGGLVAFAMARQLAAEGEATELLALIDTLPPETATAPATDEELVASFAQDMARLLGSEVGISPEALRSLPEPEKLAHVVRLGHTAGLLPADFGLARIEPLFATFAANLQASRAYAPEPYTGRLTLWVSEATAASHAAALDAWSRLVPAGLDRTLLPGDHYSLLRRPEVERLARELAAILTGPGSLDQAQGVLAKSPDPAEGVLDRRTPGWTSCPRCPCIRSCSRSSTPRSRRKSRRRSPGATPTPSGAVPCAAGAWKRSSTLSASGSSSAIAARSRSRSAARWTAAERSLVEKRFQEYLIEGGFPEAQGLSPRFESSCCKAMWTRCSSATWWSVTASRRWPRCVGSCGSACATPPASFSVHRLHQDLKSQGHGVAKDTVHAPARPSAGCLSGQLRAAGHRIGAAANSNPRKLYPADPGLIRAYDASGRSNLGHALETAVLNEIERRKAEVAYVRPRKAIEVDFHARHLFGAEELVQVCADPAGAMDRELRALTAGRAGRTRSDPAPPQADPGPGDSHRGTRSHRPARL